MQKKYALFSSSLANSSNHSAVSSSVTLASAYDERFDDLGNPKTEACGIIGGVQDRDRRLPQRLEPSPAKPLAQDADLGCSANGMKAQARLRATGGPARFSMLRKLWGDRHYHDTAAISTETPRLSGWLPGSTRRLRSAS
jgi:hypothetical protein